MKCLVRGVTQPSKEHGNIIAASCVWRVPTFACMHHVHKQPAGCKARHQQDMHAGRAGRPAMAADRGRHRDIFAGSRHVCVRLRARCRRSAPIPRRRRPGRGHARARRRVRPLFARVAGRRPGRCPTRSAGRGGRRYGGGPGRRRRRARRSGPGGRETDTVVVHVHALQPRVCAREGRRHVRSSLRCTVPVRRDVRALACFVLLR